MARETKSEGLELMHLIGPGTEHKYEPATKKELAEKFDEQVKQGRNQFPREIHFTTWTLRYNKLAWLEVDALERHWVRARVTAKVLPDGRVQIVTTNVAALTVHVDAFPKAPSVVVLDGVELPTRLSGSERRLEFDKGADGWRPRGKQSPPLMKRHALQGPIDDAFMDSFLFVRPTGKSTHGAVAKWVESEMKRAVEQWRAQFRGEAMVKNDVDVSERDLAENHLVLWGDPQSNKLLARINKDLPVRWEEDELKIGDQSFKASDHVVAMVYPNPLQPTRYVVLNSGFTFRGFGSNADQTPKLPDYAVINLKTPPSVKAPGEVVAAGFFDEHWKWRRDLKPTE